MSIPASLPDHVTRILRLMGETVVYTSPDNSVTWSAQGSVQAPSSIGLVNEMDQDFLVLFLSAKDVPVDPVRLGSIYVRGRTRAIEDIVIETPGGVPTYYMVRLRG